MLRVLPDAAPLDYRLCNQTVTLYHLSGKMSDFRCTCTVFHGAYLESEQTGGVEKTGETGKHSFLLVLPSGNSHPVWGEDYTLRRGDKVLMGEGSVLQNGADWQSLQPASRNDLFVVRSIAVRSWDGKICHVEVRG